MALTNQNHQLITAHFANKDTSKMIAVDATCGNGHDTLFLAKLGFKQVYAFDIQQQAINNTQQQINQQGHKNVTLFKTSHEALTDNVSETVDCIMFNLGYLPNADKNITTTEQTSLNALEQSIKLLANEGLVSVLCYPGHPEGAKETTTIQSWVATLSTHWHVNEILASHPGPKAPILYLISKT